MASKEYEIAFKLASDMTSGFSKTFSSANKAVQGFNKQLVSLNKQAADVDKVVKLRKETGEAARTYIQAKQKVAELGQAISKTNNPTKEMTAEFNKAKSAVEKAKTSLDKKKTSLKQLETQVGTTGSSLKTLINRQNELKTSADKARRSQEKLVKINEKLEKASNLQSSLKSGAASSAGSLAGIGAGAAALGAATVLPAMQMEDAMAEVRKVTDFTPEGLEKVRKEIELMSTKIPLSADGLAQIMASAAQSGVAQKDLLGFTEQAAKMGVAFDITAEEAGTMMAKWQSGMGLSQEQTYKLADAVNALSNVNAATAPQIGEVLKRYGALGKVAGLTEKETAAFAASVVASGAESEVAATGIKAFMRALGKGGSMTKKQAAAYENVGLNPKELQKNLQKDAPKAIITALEAIQKNVPKEKWNQYLSVMFGEEAQTAVGPMMSNLEGLKKNFKMVGDEANYAGSMLNEFKARSETTSNALTLAKNAASYAARAIGQPLLQPIKQLSTEFVAVAVKTGQWIAKNQELVMKILKVVGAVTGAIAAFHAIRIAISFLISPIVSIYKGYLNLQKAINLVKNSTVLNTVATKAATAAQKLWNASINIAKLVAQKAAMVASKVAMVAWNGICKAVTAAQWLWNAALNANPIGLVIAAIAGLVAGGIALYKNWDTIKEKAKALWASIKNIFGKIGKAISNAWDKAKGFFSGKKSTINVNAAGGGVRKMATGGIATKPTNALIAEAGEPEVVFPLSKLNRFLDNRGKTGFSGMSVNFAPVINVSGGSGNAYAEVERGLKAGQQSLKKELEKLMRNQRRLSYV